MTENRTANGKYIIDGFKMTNDNGNGFMMVRNIGWCEYSNKLSSVLIPNVGWVTY